MIRSDERVEFLRDCLTGAIENFGYGWFEVKEYRWEDAPNAYAVVIETEEEGRPEHRIDLDLIAKGLGVIKRAELRDVDDEPGVQVLHNSTTGERLFMSEGMRRNIMLADRTNGEDGDLDVVCYLAIVECGLFGKVDYA